MKRLFSLLTLVFLALLVSGNAFASYADGNFKDGGVTFSDKKFEAAKIEFFEGETGKSVDSQIIELQPGKTEKFFFQTPVIAVESGMAFKNARVTLPKTGEIDAIFKCQNFDAIESKCGENWVKTEIPFETKLVTIPDLNGSTRTVETIVFTVTSFSAYGGGKIEIVKAEHLSQNREFIADIFEEVRKKDGVWSEAIPVNDFVRVKFAEPLSKKNDITVYARANQNATIKVFKKDGSEEIAEITGIKETGWYRTLLTGLAEGETLEDFDLKITGNPIEFDYIVDPTYDDFEDGTISKWTALLSDGGTFAASTSAKKYGSYGGRMTTNGANSGNYLYYWNGDVTGNEVNLYTWVRTSNASAELAVRYTLHTTDYAEIGQIRISLGYFKYMNAAGGLVNFTTTPSNDTWYRLRIHYNNTTDKVDYYLYDTDDVLLESVTNITSPNPTAVDMVSIVAEDTVASPYTTDWDNTCYADTEEPEPPPTPEEYAVTFTLTGINGEMFNSFPVFYYPLDGNKTIDFDIIDNNNSRLYLDLNYSALPIVGTGTPIVKDLNLTSDYCPNQDWNGETSSCTYAWNYGGVPDGNYAIIGSVRTEFIDGNTGISDGNVRFQSYAHVLILPPIDEETFEVIDLNTYGFRVTYNDGNTIQTFPNLTSALDLNVSLGLAFYVSLKIDENTSDYYPRSYYLKYTTSVFFDTFQPYLVKKSTVGGGGIQSVLFTRAENNLAIPGIEIRSYRLLPDKGLSLIEQIVTDVAGSATFSFVQNADYSLNFLKDGNVFSTVSLRPVYSSYQFYISEAIFTVPDENAIDFNVEFFPSDSYIDTNTVVDLNLNIDVQSAIISDLNILVYLDDNLLYNSVVFVDGFYNLPDLSIVGAKPGSVLNVEVVLTTSTGLKISRSHAYSFNLSVQQKGFLDFIAMAPGMLNLKRHSEHKEISTLVAVILTIFIVGAISKQAQVDLGGTALLAMLLLGIFTYLGFVYLPAFFVTVIICFGLMIFARSY